MGYKKSIYLFISLCWILVLCECATPWLSPTNLQTNSDSRGLKKRSIVDSSNPLADEGQFEHNDSENLDETSHVDTDDLLFGTSSEEVNDDDTFFGRRRLIPLGARGHASRNKRSDNNNYMEKALKNYLDETDNTNLKDDTTSEQHSIEKRQRYAPKSDYNYRPQYNYPAPVVYKKSEYSTTRHVTTTSYSTTHHSHHDQKKAKKLVYKSKHHEEIVKKLKAKKAAIKKKLGERHTAIKTKIKTKVDAKKKAFRDAKNDLKKRWSDKKAEIKKHIEAEKATIKKAYADYKAEYKKKVDQYNKDFEEWWNRVFEAKLSGTSATTTKASLTKQLLNW